MNIAKEIHYDVKDSIGYIYFNRPVYNFLNEEIITSLTELYKSWEQDKKVRGVLLSSNTPDYFCNGLDVHELLKLDGTKKLNFFTKFTDLIIALHGFSKPHICALNGSAMGGGAFLAILSDYRIFSDGPYRFAFPEVKIGLGLPDAFIRLISSTSSARGAKRAALFGEAFKPNQALEMELIDEIVPANELKTKAEKVIAKFLKYPDKSFQLTKMEFRKPLQNYLIAKQNETVEFFKNFFDDNLIEGLSSIAQNRRPRFDLNI